MLVLDDGSSDDTAGVAEAVGDPRVRVFREPHRGIERLAETYNRGLQEAQAPLIAILEGDDLWEPGKLERQLPDFDDPNVVLSAGRMRIQIEGKADQISPASLLSDDVLKNCPVGRAGLEMLRPLVLTFTFALTVIMRRDALARIGGFLQPSHLPVVDYPTFLQLSLEGEWRFHEEVLGTWRRHDASTTRSRFPAIFEGCYRYAWEFFVQHGPSLGADAKALEREWHQMQSLRQELSGRIKASQQDFRAANRLFDGALCTAPSARARLLLTAANWAVKLRLSPEPLFRAAGREDWRTLSRISESDPLVDPDLSLDAYSYWSFTDPMRQLEEPR